MGDYWVSKREVIGCRITGQAIQRQTLAIPSVPNAVHGEIVQLIQQLKRRSELDCQLDCKPGKPTDNAQDLDIRVLPRTLAALAAQRRT